MCPGELTDGDRSRYQWQLGVPGFGEDGQARLKAASVLVSRVGGLGSPVAYELAAAGIGRLVLAHGGNLRTDDLNRQLLMTNDWIGKPRVQCAARRLRELNPELEVVAVEANVSDTNAAELVGEVDLVVDCAPVFEERYAMNEAAFTKGIPIVECAMYDLDLTITSQQRGRTRSLRELVPQPPVHWKREFPVFGAVSGTVGCLGAMEAIKILAGFGEPLWNRMLMMDLRSMSTRLVTLPTP